MRTRSERELLEADLDEMAEKELEKLKEMSEALTIQALFWKCFARSSPRQGEGKAAHFSQLQDETEQFIDSLLTKGSLSQAEAKATIKDHAETAPSEAEAAIIQFIRDWRSGHRRN